LSFAIFGFSNRQFAAPAGQMLGAFAKQNAPSPATACTLGEKVRYSSDTKLFRLRELFKTKHRFAYSKTAKCVYIT
jgi:hypothetical protein